MAMLNNQRVNDNNMSYNHQPTPGFLPLLTCTTVRKQKMLLRGSLEVSCTWRTSWGESYGRWDWSFYWGKYGKMILPYIWSWENMGKYGKLWENMGFFQGLVIWAFKFWPSCSEPTDLQWSAGTSLEAQVISLEAPLAVSVVSSSAEDAKWMRCPGSTDIFLSNQCEGVSALASSTMWG